MQDQQRLMLCSPRALAAGTVLAWVLWTILSNFAFLNLELYKSEFMFRVVASMIQLVFLIIACIAYHIKSGKRICETASRLLFFGFILGIIIGPGNVIAHQAISQSGASLFLVTTLPLMPICWAVNYCMSVEPFNKTQGSLLLISLATLFWMYSQFKTTSSNYVVSRTDSYTLFFQMFKSEGVTSGLFFSFYLAMILLMFEMAMPFLQGPFDIINQICCMQFFSLLFNLAGVFKYEHWNPSVILQPKVAPYLAAYVIVDLAFILGLFLSVHPDFAKNRFALLMRAPLGCFLCTLMLGEPIDFITMIGGSILFVAAGVGEYFKYIETLANNMTMNNLPVADTEINPNISAETVEPNPPQQVQ